MTHISVGPFSLDATLQGSDIKISMSVGYHGISMHESFSLSLSHPSITWNSPTVADFSVSLSIGYDDNDGSVSVKATETYPELGWHGISKHHKHQSVTVRILPDHALAYITSGLPSAGINWMMNHLPVGEIPTPGDVATFMRLLSPSRLAGLKQTYEYVSGPDKGHHLFDGLMSLMKGTAANGTDKAHFAAISAVNPGKWVEAIRRCVADPTVQAYFPGIASHVDFGDAAFVLETGVTGSDEKPDKPTTEDRIKAIAADVFEGSIAVGAAIGVIAGIVFGALGVVAAVTSVPSGGTSLPAVGVVAIIAAIVLVLAALAVLAIGVVAGLVYLAVDGYLLVAGTEAPRTAGSAYPMLDQAAAAPA